VTERYELIAAEKAAGGAPATVAQMCSWAEVSPSGFYAWVGRGASARARARVTTGGLVAAAFAAGRGTYGARRVRAVLIASGHPISLRSARSHLRVSRGPTGPPHGRIGPRQGRLTGSGGTSPRHVRG
jgi:hypothetical protein